MSYKQLYIPKGYKDKLGLRATEQAIQFIKHNFEKNLAFNLNLERVSAPLCVFSNTGLNDDLNGVERAVCFDVPDIKKEAEIVHSLAKWKRMALARYGFEPGCGLYTDMNAIRRDEVLDNIHSMYVDQWDWEKVIIKEDRNTDTLINTVKAIYQAIKKTEKQTCQEFGIVEILPENIEFVTTQELENTYPNLSPKERETVMAKEKRAIFVMNIGGELKSGTKHDGRAPDYDDWDLNGDILVYYPVLDIALELSSMGIRVDEDSLVKQLEIAGCKERLSMEFHKSLLEGKLPYTIGGGIGQSRLCMLLLHKAHIGEVQVSLWDEQTYNLCAENRIELL